MDSQPSPDPLSNDQEEFFPRGAIAFFVLMIIMFALLWFSMYFEVLDRI